MLSEWHAQFILLLDLSRIDPTLAECGMQLVDELRSAADSLQREETSLQLENMIGVAHERLRTSSNPSPWRRLFTDASILRSLADCVRSMLTQTSITRLDKAIIIAGAVGPGRLDLIHRLIVKIQRSSSFDDIPLASPITVTSLPPTPLATTSKAIPCLSSVPSFTSFQFRYSRSPFMLVNYAKDWPALQEHAWSSNEYLSIVAGPARVVPVEIGSDYRNDNWTATFMDWQEFLNRLDCVNESVVYLAQHDVMMQFPALRADIEVPDYVYSSLSPCAEYPAYKPPGNDDQLIINAWLGPKGTLSPAHTDPYFNLYVQVVGRKTVWIAPPKVSSSMRAYSVASDSSSSMSNTSRLDVFLNTPEAHSLEFRAEVVPEAMGAVLQPGDMLFIPPGWWHAMRSEDKSFSVSMWF